MNRPYLALIFISLALPAAVSAQGRPSLRHAYGHDPDHYHHVDPYDHYDRHDADDQALTLALDVGWNADRVGGDELQVLSPTFSASFAFPSVELSLDWPLVYLDLEGVRGDSTLVSGNPFLAAHLVKRSERGVFKLGFGVALPVADVDRRPGGLFTVATEPEQPFESIAYGYARAIRGSWNSWLYYPDQLTLVIPAVLEKQAGLLVLGAEGAAALLVPIDDGVDDDTDLILQAAGSLALRIGALTAGLRLQAVWGPTSDGDAQLSGVPFVQADFRSGGFAYARFLMNLDEPLGFFGDGAELWGIFVGVGATL